MEKKFQFDLLCETDGQLVRLPYQQGMNADPMAIFPFAGDSTFIMFNEAEGLLRFNADEERLPTVKLFVRLWRIRNSLNKCLKALGKPILKGYYFVRAEDENDKKNWCVKFDAHDNYDNIKVESCDADWPAAIRYVDKI